MSKDTPGPVSSIKPRYSGFMDIFVDSDDRGINLVECAESGNSYHGFVGNFACSNIGEDIPLVDFIKSEKMWRRLICTVLEQSLATLKSSQGLIVI